MIVLFGKTCSGKSTVLQFLVDKYGYKKIVTYTTRPKRPNEKDGVDYHFITEEEFKKLNEEKFFLETQMYVMAGGNKVWYGSAYDDYKNADNKTIVILTPEGVKKLRNTDIPFTAFYIYANQTTIKQRLKDRGDNSAEANRRVEADYEDFKGAELLAKKIVYSNLNTSISSVVEKLLYYINSEENK